MFGVNKNVSYAIERLTGISSDLSKMIAVHEERLDTHDKRHEQADARIEERRRELIESTEKILKCVDSLQAQADDRRAILEKRMAKFEKILWMGMGVGGVIVVLFNIWQHLGLHIAIQ